MAVVESTDLEQLITTLPGYDPRREADGFYFDVEAAAAVITFWEAALTHVKGALGGKPYLLEDHEKAILANLFGWKREDGSRRYRWVLYYVPRGNSKTTFAAGLVLATCFLDREPGAEVYSTAASRDQAKLVYKIIKGMIENEPRLAKYCTIFQHHIIINGTEYKPLAAEANTAHGLNPHLVVNDELHAHKTREFIDAIQTALHKRQQPIRFDITTADYEREGSICNEVHDYACKVRDGEIDAPHMLPVIYEVTKEQLEADGDYWKTDEAAYQANPMLGKAIPLESFKAQVQAAIDVPARENEVKRLHFNILTDSKDMLINMEHWLGACSGPLDIERWRGQQAIGCGFDIGNTSDLTAGALLFDAGEWWELFVLHWTPRASALKRQHKDDGADYLKWSNDGWLNLTEGNVSDYKRIAAEFAEFITAHGITLPTIQIDWLFQGASLGTELQELGFDIEPFRQGFLSYAAPTKEFIDRIKGGKLRHGDSPILRWQASHLQAAIDPAGNMKPAKDKSGNKIDGLVASIMAVNGALKGEITGSYYDTHDVRVI